MNEQSWKIQKRIDGTIEQSQSVFKPFAAQTGDVWLIVVPHDDDAVLGMGLLIQAAHDAGISVHCAVVSDGSMGFSMPTEREGLVERRQAELMASCAILGIQAECVHVCGLPDCSLTQHQGMRRDATGALSGISWELTRIYRQLAPSCVFASTGTDYHPDHRAVASEVDMACFFASCGIWLELGEPVPVPDRWDFAVYCAFKDDPDLRLTGTEESLQIKLKAIEAFESQPEIISTLVKTVREDGPIEHFVQRSFQLYHPQQYNHLFPS